MFHTLTSIEAIHEKINAYPVTFFYITQPDCSVCHGLQPQLEQLFKKFPDIHTYHVDASQVPRVAGDFLVFTAPTLLLFVDGKEYIREARIVQTARFREKIAHIHKERLEH